MSRNDYTKYAKEPRTETPVIEREVEVEPVVETPVESEPVFQPEEINPIVETPEDEPEIIEPETVEEISRKFGRVIGCVKLNVRRAPKPRAEVVCEINCDTEVEVDEGESTIDFYKICTASGVEGYCVKTYISVMSDK